MGSAFENRPPELVVLSQTSQGEVEHLRASRFSRTATLVTFWSERRPLTTKKVTQVLSPGTSSEYRYAFDVEVYDPTKRWSVEQVEVRCDQASWRLVQSIEYDAKGSVVDSFSASSDQARNPFREVVPGTVGETALETVCLIR